MTFPLARAARLPHEMTLPDFAEAAGLHPDLVERLVTLGLVEVTTFPDGALGFAVRELATVARIRRLHDELTLNYAAVGVVLDLLDRIDELEDRLARRA
ncbi:chaperone modulator CbpM [Dactylosporangium sp. NPDC000521]|uniref:chaperone modulator CbpM n=1 Tax=Dactylosporangium sp. NPDC000521 TaxID=3363975 RepID=UPI0036C36389